MCDDRAMRLIIDFLDVTLSSKTTFILWRMISPSIKPCEYQANGRRCKCFLVTTLRGAMSSESCILSSVLAL
jgi:hypothetical protein